MENKTIPMLCAVMFTLIQAAEAGIYKWYDEAGKVHYTQKPPPKDGRRAGIDTSTFSNVQTVKAPPIQKTVRPKARPKPVKKKTIRRTRCPYQ